MPGNDDAIRSVALLTRIIADAVADGLIERSSGRSGEQAKSEPMPDWERELLGADEQAAAATEETAAAPAEQVDRPDNAEQAEAAADADVAQAQAAVAEQPEAPVAEAAAEEAPAADSR